MIVLYEHPLSPYAQKIKIALREKGIEFESKTPNVSRAGFGGNKFIEANPRAEVPALIDGDVKIFDSTIILEYIEDKWSFSIRPCPLLICSSVSCGVKFASTSHQLT
jgi:glutathione S-transferase/RNA polymerase-associated protein